MFSPSVYHDDYSKFLTTLNGTTVYDFTGIIGENYIRTMFKMDVYTTSASDNYVNLISFIYKSATEVDILLDSFIISSKTFSIRCRVSYAGSSGKDISISLYGPFRTTVQRSGINADIKYTIV